MQPNIRAIKESRRRRLAELLDEHGKTKLSGIVEIGADYLWQMGKGQGKSRRGVNDENARQIESKLNKPVGWMDALAMPSATLTAKDGAKNASVSTTETRPDYVRFPLLDGFAGMGRGDYMGDFPEVVDFVEVTREWASEKLRSVPASAVRVITGRGQSMRGVYEDGDLVFVDSRVKEFDADAAYVFRWHGRVQIKRLQLIGQDKVRVLSANPDFPPVDVPLAEVEIGGRALAAWTLREF